MYRSPIYDQRFGLFIVHFLCVTMHHQFIYIFRYLQFIYILRITNPVDSKQNMLMCCSLQDSASITVDMLTVLSEDGDDSLQPSPSSESL